LWYRSIKEVRGNAQRTKLIASSPCSTDLVGLALHFASSMASNDADATALAESSEKLERVLTSGV
jgi:hypothetical protein